MKNCRLVVMGSSLGGLKAFSAILSAINSESSLSFAIVQHIGSDTKGNLTELLNQKTRLPVKEVEDKEAIRPGIIYVAPAGYHLLIEKEETFSLSVDEKENHSRPSIDILFESAAAAYGDTLLGVLLTGMNTDGAKGLAKIQQHGGFTIVQEPSTAQAAEMPLAALKAHTPNHVLSLQDIGAFLNSLSPSGETQGDPIMMNTQTRVNILAVDDKANNLFALENILKSPDLNIVRASSGNEALAKLLEMDFACVLLDVQMPEMDGFELARIIRDDDRTRLIPIIFSSGNQKAEADVFKGYEAGAVDYLLKPLDPTIVRSKVKVFAELYRKEAALKLAESTMTKYAKELKSSNDELEQRVADRMKELSFAQAQTTQLQKMDAIGSLAGGVAHDFNNLLAAITMYCDLTEDFVNNPEQILKSIGEIRKVATRGADLTRQLLTFSRKQTIQPKNIELNMTLNGILNMLMRLIGKNIEVITRFAQPLDLICADPVQIEQVALNLVVNARDAMPNGGIITMETKNSLMTPDMAKLHLDMIPGPHVMLSVSDTGTGMDEITRTRLFEPFYTTKPAGKGTGLGLSTVYGIIKQSKATIEVESELGKGTVFKIYFPTVTP